MDCSKYENKSDELIIIVDNLLENKLQIDLENINNLSCLLCKNLDKGLIPRILPYLEQNVSEGRYNSLHWYALARVSQIIGNNTRAEEAYQKAINLDPLNTDYLERMARFYMSNNNWQKALEYCNRFLGLSPDKKQTANSIMLSVFYGCGMYKEAVQNFEIGIDLSNLQSVYKAMYSYIMLGKHDKVIALIDEIKLDDNDESYAVINQIAEAYFSLKDYDKALESYLKLSESDYKKYRNNIAATYSNMNNFDKSMPILKEILAENPNDVNALANYALTILKIDTEKNFNEAVECYQKIVCLDPLNTNAYNMLGMIHYETKKYELAYEFYIKLLELTPNDNWVIRRAILCLLGGIQQSSNSKDDAHKGVLLSNILKNNSNLNATDCVNLGIFHRILGNSKESIEITMRSLELEPTESYNLYFAGIAFHFSKNYDISAKYFEKALLSDKDNLMIYNEYINCLLDAKNIEKALEIARKVTDISKTSRTLNQLSVCYCELEKYNKAKPLLLKALDLETVDMNFKQEIKNNLLFSYVMSNSSQELLELMDSVDYKETFNDDFSKSMKVILNLRVGNYKEVSEIIPIIKDSFFPENSDAIFKAFASFNLKKENWSNDCIAWLKNIDLSDMQYLAYKEDLARCLGLAYREQNNPNEALIYFKVASEVGKRNAVNWYDLGIEQLYLKNKSDAAISIKNASNCDNCDDIKPLKYFNEKFSDYTIKDETKLELMLKFFEMLTLVYRIKGILRYTDNKPVYHYTRLNVLKELLKDNAKLRLSNAAHMNDPLEGTAIYELLNKVILDDTETFDIMIPPNVFLTSFCSSGDELPLWVQYAADGTGCSLELDYKFFDTVDNDFYDNTYRVKLKKENYSEELSFSIDKRLDNQFKDIGDLVKAIPVGIDNKLPYNMDATMELISKINNSPNLPKLFEFLRKLFTDNISDTSKNPYCLYKVAYLNKEKGVISLSESDNKEINDNLNLLNELIFNTCQQLKEAGEDKGLIDAFNEITKELLLEIQYLFKLDSYIHEKEIRLLKRVSIDEPIVKEFSIGDNIPTLYIEIDKQLHFNKCILGPKVSHPSKIAPALYRNKVIDKVEASKIKYR